MTYRNKTDLATAVLRRLSVVSAYETARADDLNHVKDIYDGVARRLEVEGVFNWNPDEIPDDVFSPLCDYICLSVAEDYNLSGEKYLRVKASSNDALRYMRRRIALPPTRGQVEISVI